MVEGEGASFEAAPPPSGLGNFKGVMLCNRPSEDASKARGVGGEEPFRSMIAATYSDAPGLTPARNFEPSVKKRGPSAALRRHVRWLRELQEQMREEREQVEAEEQDEEARRIKMKAVVDGHREKVRSMMQERDAANREAEENEKAIRTMARAAAAAPGSTVPPAPPAAAPKPKPKAAKPMWAMTEKEKDQFEEEEGDDLINFAENLDFDKFVGDLEFRQGLDALKDRAGKLKKEQDAFKDELLANFNSSVDEDEDYEESTAAGSLLEDGIDGQSLLGSEYSVTSSRRARREKEQRGDGKEDWDNSTNAGDDRSVVDPEVKEMAEVVLANAPHIRAVHSKASVEKLIQKAQKEKGIEEDNMDLVSFMRAEGPVPVPVITASSDVQNRLHKPADPSQLPYLYRSPAV
mmetsp:Transcript_4390/g.7791  ORF Transcript_4390/g.7791 Transcript_4390/m.7791 type:complete len:406 (-) Transcript_4390:120-1337(-)|eukprot:CAMPEP_0197659070 /NCGR_PEP_ID=MMETSP1338-20131121/46085_1 /TAXON_ID=43686 ORGANISM="Pelagodinium beii, Strain RCC1491" /NCGR_SAMPLE_ID=MMETSP1338 /ASSEMBLY_ACC=CAM_ASM_000754 /LENGTH=405 /DNA_ID=CAMNT_0043235817 /DNA_START=69 /DNA_END=1286 /DNA_ORIENTATION=+